MFGTAGKISVLNFPTTTNLVRFPSLPRFEYYFLLPSFLPKLIISAFHSSGVGK